MPENLNVNIVNGSPAIYNLGVLDHSSKGPTPRPIKIGKHVPLIFTFAAGGPTGKQVVDPSRLIPLYKKETFDRKKPYFTHATRLLEKVTGAGSTVAMVRVIPDDNDTIANMTIYLDVLKDDVNVYKRHVDGSIAYDDDGNPIVDKTVKGYRVKVIMEYNNDDEDTPLGTKTSKTGYMEDGDGNKSTMYPIMEVRAAYKGSYYNNVGLAFGLPTTDDNLEAFIEKNIGLPWKLFVYRRPESNATGVKVKTLYNSENSITMLKKDAEDPVTGENIELKNSIKSWYNTTNPLEPLVYPEVGKVYVYYDNLEFIQKSILEVEKEYINADVDTVEGVTVNTSAWLDYLMDKPVDDQWGIVNPFTALSIKRVPAFTYYIDETAVDLPENQKEVYFAEGNPMYLGYGKDGTLSDEEFEKQIREYMRKYLDKNSEVMDVALNVENVLYDSGFSLETKKELINFIAIRKDTIVGLSTRINSKGDDNWDSLETQRSIGLTLKARLNLAPESTFFGTSVTRAFIVVGSGIDEKDPAKRRYPLIMHIAYKAAKMMSGDAWKREELFDSGEKNAILDYSEIEPRFIPEGVKPALWNVGLIWPQPLRGNIYTFPQLQSVYDNDTSILNNIFAAFALTIINKVADAAHRKFSGNISLGPVELTTAVTNYMAEELEDKFAGLFKIEVNAFITDYDDIRGYSWTTATKISGEVMKTAMTHYIESKRKEEM